MGLAIRDPLRSIFSSEDKINQLLGLGVVGLLGSLPFFMLAFLFYEKRLFKKQQKIQISHGFFGLTFFKRSFALQGSLLVEHFLDSPNLARKDQDSKKRAFYNQGYFKLWGVTPRGKKIFLDRHSSKKELIKLKHFLESF